MALGAVLGPPYTVVQAVAAWAALNWGYLRGRLLLAGVRASDLSARDLIDVAFCVVLDDSTGMSNVHEARERLVEAMERAVPDRETWGEGEGAEAVQASVEDFLGGPAMVPEDWEPG